MATIDPITADNIGLGPDGEKIVDPSYYLILGVRGDVDQETLRKQYRKLALKNHPDRNIGDESAAARFQEIGEAYGTCSSYHPTVAILSDSNARAVYNKQGKKSAVNEAGGEAAMPDPGEMFGQIFGGKAFEDWIGEISLGKDVSKAFEMSTTEEEREQLKAEMMGTDPSKKAADQTATVGATPAAAETTTTAATASNMTVPPPQGSISHSTVDDIPAGPGVTTTGPVSTDGKSAPTTSTSFGTATATSPIPGASTAAAGAHASLSAADAAEEKEKKRKLEAEKREKMEQFERERAEEKKQRIKVLSSKLKDRIRPFVEAKNPGANDDPETQRYLARIKEETMDLALESFGVELCHLIGQIYMQKASSYLKLHKKSFFSNALGVPGWWSRIKEKGQMVKEGWSFLSVGMEVQRSMAEMEKRQEKGELDEAEAKKIEADMSGKLLLVAWKGSKFELSTVLRQVVDAVLVKDSPEVTDAILTRRAQAIMFTGAILKTVKPEEGDDERRELEKLVAEASRKRKEKKLGSKPVKE
ncbi:BQ2448_1665 [Microbotryum intermedium]|uniref:BQ2448_1665 protein n=1 Tax=Microbotryum intermedium TaxID=269621 RepID=A0A238FDS3_9BASI|nr:BQ2448_1665 [Microbotryum intermedium]